MINTLYNNDDVARLFDITGIANETKIILFNINLIT